MATDEMKSETKKTEHKQKQSTQIKQDLPPPTIPPLPLPYKVSYLVPLHAHNYNIVSHILHIIFFLYSSTQKF
jgi:hypothetical protein